MGVITKIFDMDLSKLVPAMPVFLGFVRTLLVLAVLAGPVLLTVLGAMYLFKPAPEANFKYGFRTYFGMGSIEAWQFSQKIAGLIFGALGVLLRLGTYIRKPLGKVYIHIGNSLNLFFFCHRLSPLA